MIKQFLKTKKIGKIFLILFIFVCLSFLIFFGINLDKYANLQLGREAIAAGGFPYQIGLTGVTVIQCQVQCLGTCCTGGKLCTFKDPATCATYSDVSGSMAGGDGSMALFQTSSLNSAGVSSGGQLIAGGMGATNMDGGVLAGVGGCVGSGCARLENKNFWEKTRLAFRYVIATTQESIDF